MGKSFVIKENNVAVSIIIATFNSEKTLRNALDSVLHQSYQDWECLVVDGASKDDTIEIVKEYVKKDSRFRYISEPDKGVYDAFNKGWKMAKGQWIHYLGDDDVLTKKGIDDLMKHEDSSIDVLSGHCYVKKINGEIKPSYTHGMKGCHQGKLMRRSILERYGGFDTSYRILADLDLMNRLSNDGIPVEIINTFVAIFSMGGLSQNLKGINMRFKERIKIYKHYGIKTLMIDAYYTTIRDYFSIIYRKFLKIINNISYP